MDVLAMTMAQVPGFPCPPNVLGALMAMRRGLVEWLTTNHASVFLIVSDEAKARDIARQIGAELVGPAPSGYVGTMRDIN